MKLLAKRIQIGLFVVLTTLFLFSCSMLDGLGQKKDSAGNKVPSLSKVSPSNDDELEAGKIYEFSFECDELDIVRVSYQNPDEEIDYEYIYKENGSFKKRLWIPLKATKVQLYVVSDQEKIYTGPFGVGKTYKVKGTKSYGSYVTPDSYDKANSYRTNEPYPFIENIAKDSTLEAKRKSDPLAYVEEVCAKIKGEAKDDFEKAKMIHDLLALIIPYDMEGLKEDPMPPQDYWTVLKTTKGVCQGYALTFNKFCEVIGLDCDYVFGWNRSDTHAWDIVKIEGKSYLMDVTWDAGRAVDGGFNKKYSTEYLFVKPYIFAFSHFPKHQEHQLLATPIGSKAVNDINDSKAAFNTLPDVTPLYFDMIENPDNDVIGKLKANAKATDGKYSFSYKLRDDVGNVNFGIRALKGENDANKIIKYNPTTKGGEALFSFPEAGTYSARVILFKNGESTGTVVAQFKIDVDKAATESYVEILNPLVAVNPVEETLKLGQTYEFYTLWNNEIVSASICYFTEGVNGYLQEDKLTKEADSNLYKASITVPSKDFNLNDVKYKVTKACIIVEMNKDDGTGTGKYVAATYKVTE